MLNREIALGEGNCFVNLGEHAGNLAGSIGRGSARRSLKIFCKPADARDPFVPIGAAARGALGVEFFSRTRDLAMQLCGGTGPRELCGRPIAGLEIYQLLHFGDNILGIRLL